MKITAIKQQLKRRDRYSVFVDGVYVCSLSEGGLIESQLASGQELDDAEFVKLKKMAGVDKAYGSALRYVAMRPRSEWELQDYFSRKQVNEVAADQIIERLRGLDLLNDTTFARSWVESRRLLKPTSKRRLKLELQQKHVGEDIIRQVLEGDGTDERAQLQQLIAKKRSRYPDEQKLVQYLARQGFSYDDIKAVLHNPEEELG